VSHPKAKLIKKKLLENNIHLRTIYPYPIHLMKAYKNLIKNKKNLKITKKFSKEIFSLPLYPELKNNEINKICINLVKTLDLIKSKN